MHVHAVSMLLTWSGRMWFLFLWDRDNLQKLTGWNQIYRGLCPHTQKTITSKVCNTQIGCQNPSFVAFDDVKSSSSSSSKNKDTILKLQSQLASSSSFANDDNNDVVADDDFWVDPPDDYIDDMEYDIYRDIDDDDGGMWSSRERGEALSDSGSVLI